MVNIKNPWRGKMTSPGEKEPRKEVPLKKIDEQRKDHDYSRESYDEIPDPPPPPKPTPSEDKE